MPVIHTEIDFTIERLAPQSQPLFYWRPRRSAHAHASLRLPSSSAMPPLCLVFTSYSPRIYLVFVSYLNTRQIRDIYEIYTRYIRGEYEIWRRDSGGMAEGEEQQTKCKQKQSLYITQERPSGWEKRYYHTCEVSNDKVVYAMKFIRNAVPSFDSNHKFGEGYDIRLFYFEVQAHSSTK